LIAAREHLPEHRPRQLESQGCVPWVRCRSEVQRQEGWIQELLRDRSERVAQIDEVRSRLEQAFRYLTGLCTPRYESERSKKERDQRMRNS
jgi:hypothetical protein